MLRTFLTCILFITGLSVFSQKENNIWYFGNGAGIDFASGKPIAVTNGSLYTNEGCASICDGNGKLLFYTDGVTVWNKEHNEMPNGTVLNGHYSSTQSAIIIPKPGHPENYYIFTVDEKAGKEGICYSLVDMKASGGRGDVKKKNVSLLGAASEKLAATTHGNNKGVWVVAHHWNSNAFYAWLVTAEGVGEPIISMAGAVHKDYGSGKKSEAIGQMKFSWDGKLLVCANQMFPEKNVEFFEFDNISGEVKLKYSLGTSNKSPYGVCFSPNNQLVYVSFENNGSIMQYDVSSLSAGSVNKKLVVAETSDRRVGAMQMGPDGRIYIATSTPFLDVIDDPDQLGTSCNYKLKAVGLKGRYSAFGLPEMVAKSGWVTIKKEKPEEKFTKKPCKGTFKVNLGRDSVLCADELVLNPGLAGAYKWSTGETSLTIKARFSGWYGVEVEKDGCVASDSIKLDFAGRPTRFVPSKEFIPGNGSFNSQFDYMINDVMSFELKVFSKKGKEVFSSTEYSKKWDGKIGDRYASPGTYTWELTYVPKCPPQKPVTLKGKVELQKKE